LSSYIKDHSPKWLGTSAQLFLFRNIFSATLSSVSKRYEQKIAAFLRSVRGDQSYRAFAQRLKITPSMLFRFEQCQSSMNLATLQRIQAKLGVSLVDILGPDEVRRKGQLRDL